MSLPADDKKNPQYYELRAGYPKPDAAWYVKVEHGKRQRPKYSKENFVTGYDLTTGQFYASDRDLQPLLSSGRFKSRL